MKEVEDLCAMLLKLKVTKDWGLDLQEAPLQVPMKTLPAPKLITGSQVIQCNEREMKKLAAHKSQDLLQGKWVFVHSKRNQ